MGHVQHVVELIKTKEGRDPAEILSAEMPAPVKAECHREFVREVLYSEIPLSAKGTQFVPREQESEITQEYRGQVNSQNSPSETVAKGYQWTPGTEQASKSFTKMTSTTQPMKKGA